MYLHAITSTKARGHECEKDWGRMLEGFGGVKEREKCD